MAFTTDMANLVAGQLSRFITLNRHQLAGQVANLDFWIAQVCNAQEAIDGYSARFERLKASQRRYVADHETVAFDLRETSMRGRAEPPRRVADSELQQARRSLREAAYRFLIRCCNEGMVPESELRVICKSLDISMETSDLRRR